MPSLIDRIRKYHRLSDDVQIGVGFARAEAEETSPGGENRGPTIKVVATTAYAASDGMILLPQGCETDSAGRPIYRSDSRSVFYCHDYYSQLPVGKHRSAKMEVDRWIEWIAMSVATQFARDVTALILEGVINGVSVGFRVLESRAPTKEEVDLWGEASATVTRWQWLETSIAPMPADAKAWIQGIERGEHGLTADTIRAMESMVTRGKISRESAEYIGLPARRYFAVGEQAKPKKKRSLLVVM